MNTFDGIDEPVVVSAVGKKCKPSTKNHMHEQRRRRHSGVGKMPAVTCGHTKSLHFCHSDRLTQVDLLRIFESFYPHSRKTEQDEAMLHLITVQKVQRRRQKVVNTDRQKERDVTNSYIHTC